MLDSWKLWPSDQRRVSGSVLLRYGVAVVLAIGAAVLTANRPALHDAPYFIFLGAIAVSALYGGLGASFITTALSLVLVKVMFIAPQLSLYLGGHPERMERVGVFAMVALMLACLISALRRERNALKDSEERYRIVAESASDGILVIDEGQEVVFANPVIAKIFGAPAQGMLGCKLSRLLPEQQYSRHLAEVAYHMDSRRKAAPLRVETQDLRGHALSLEMTFGAFTKHGKNLFTAIIREITPAPPETASYMI